MKKRHEKLSIIMLFIMIIGMLGCNTTDPQNTSVTLNFSPESTLPKSAGDEFQINEVKLLIRNIKIKNQSSDDSLQVKVGPIAINLNLDGSITEIASSEIPPGIYNRVRFEIHKLEDSEIPPDPEFKEGSESSKRYSIIIKGQLNGVEFTYHSKKSAVQDIKLSEDLAVEENQEVNLTIKVNPFSWFFEGDKFLDPNDSSNVNKIDNNLKYAFKRAFCDKNKDGIED